MLQRLLHVSYNADNIELEHEFQSLSAVEDQYKSLLRKEIYVPNE